MQRRVLAIVPRVQTATNTKTRQAKAVAKHVQEVMCLDITSSICVYNVRQDFSSVGAMLGRKRVKSAMQANIQLDTYLNVHNVQKDGINTVNTGHSALNVQAVNMRRPRAVVLVPFVTLENIRQHCALRQQTLVKFVTLGRLQAPAFLDVFIVPPASIKVRAVRAPVQNALQVNIQPLLV